MKGSVLPSAFRYGVGLRDEHKGNIVRLCTGLMRMGTGEIVCDRARARERESQKEAKSYFLKG